MDSILTQSELDKLLEAHVVNNAEEDNKHVSGQVLDSESFLIIVKGRMVGPLAAERTFSGIRQITKSLDMHLLLDLTECSFLSSFILGELCYMAVGASERGRKVIIIGANELIKEVLSLTGVDSVLQMTQTLELALEKIAQ